MSDHDEERKSRTTYNMSEKDLEVIHQARVNAIELTLLFRYDASYALTLLDNLTIYYRQLKPSLERNKLWRTKDAEKIDELFKQCYVLAKKEAPKAYKYKTKNSFKNSLRPPTNGLYDTIDELSAKLTLLKDNLGLGFKHEEEFKLRDPLKSAFK